MRPKKKPLPVSGEGQSVGVMYLKNCALTLIAVLDDQGSW